MKGSCALLRQLLREQAYLDILAGNAFERFGIDDGRGVFLCCVVRIRGWTDCILCCHIFAPPEELHLGAILAERAGVQKKWVQVEEKSRNGRLLGDDGSLCRLMSDAMGALVLQTHLAAVCAVLSDSERFKRSKAQRHPTRARKRYLRVVHVFI